MQRLIENIRVAFQSLYASKLRAFLTMLGIIIGIGAVITIMAVGTGTQQSILSNIQSMGTNLITVSPGRENVQSSEPGDLNLNVLDAAQNSGKYLPSVRGKLYLSDYQAIKDNAATISGVAATVSGDAATVAYMAAHSMLSVTASTEDIFGIRNYKLDQGNLFNSGDVTSASPVAVIGSQVVSDYFGKSDVIGAVIKINGQNFTVVGTLQATGTIQQDNVVFIPITTGQIKFYGDKTVEDIIVQSKNKDTINQTIDEVINILRQQHKIAIDKPNNFDVRSQTQMLKTVSAITNTLSIALAGIAAISLLVGGIGIMNIMLVSVTERTREIGIRKAVGAKNRDVMTQFLTESIVLSTLGGILGILLAFLISFILQKLAGVSAIITASPIILAVCFSTAIGVIFGIFPAMRAARLNPIEALRYE
ncbi:MAG: ABC transporter permease [Candidatus Humimicrobiaceae bacterium]